MLIADEREDGGLSVMIQIKNRFLGLFLSLMLLNALLAAQEPALQFREEVPDEVLFECLVIAREEMQRHLWKKEIPRRPRPPSGDPRSAANPVHVTYLVNRRPFAAATGDYASIAVNARIAARQALQQDAWREVTPEQKIAIIAEIVLPPRSAVIPLNALYYLDVGRQGVLVEHDRNVLWINAAEFIYSGKVLWDVVDGNLRRQMNMTVQQLNPSYSVSVYDAVVGVMEENQPPFRLYRNGPLVSPDQLNREQLELTLKLAGGWYLAHYSRGNFFPGRYHPVADLSTERGINLVQHLSTIEALDQLRQYLPDGNRIMAEEFLDKVMADYFREHPVHGFGYIVQEETIRLENSAVVLAAIGSDQARIKKYRDSAEKLAAFLNFMRNPDGSYRQRFPEKEVNVEDFSASGLAQLALMRWYGITGDKELLERVSLSQEYYQKIFSRLLEMEMIPWHTRANRLLYEVTRKSEIASFIFFTNDFLLSNQDVGEMVPADCRGQFINQAGKNRTAHIANTARYLISISEALELAEKLGDRERKQIYTIALLYGMRELLQKQIRIPGDTWYMPQPEKSQGAFRNAGNLAETMIDNQNLAVIAVRRALHLLSPNDFTLFQSE